MTHKTKSSFVVMIAVLVFMMFSSAAADYFPVFPAELPTDTVPFYAGGTYDPAIPHPNDFLDQPLGLWPAKYDQLVAFIGAVAAKSNQVVVEVHGKTFEGRKLYNVIISSPENIKNLENIRAEQARYFSNESATAEKLPAVAWLGYSIHGDELSGVDAAIMLIYQLAAGTDEATLRLLDNVVIIIDPTENPDGRERYIPMLQTFQSHVLNDNPYAMQHGGTWPHGRGNHYHFDLNRDWILVTQPETEGRIQTLLKWNPQLVVDGHEMGPNATFMSSPAREPINYNTPGNVKQWWEVFSKDQGKAFDRNGWPYYVKEWHEQWFPGYGSAWPSFTGTIGILYEQARTDGPMIKQIGNYPLTYHETINHHFTASLANLNTLVDNREKILADQRKARQQIMADGKKSGLTFLFVPDGDELKMNRFVQTLLKQGIKVETATKPFTVGGATDIYQARHANEQFPEGTYLVRTAQPMGALAKAILEFDPHLKLEFLQEERREIEKYGWTRMYEASAWNLPMAFNLDAYETTSPLSVDTKPVTETATSPGKLTNADAQFGFIINMEGEKTYRLLNKLFLEKLNIFASEKAFTLEGINFKAGSLVLRRRGNPDNLVEILRKLANECSINIYGANTGVATEGSYLGAASFRLLTAPNVAIVAGEPINTSSFGTLWYALDQELEVPHSMLRLLDLSWTDISQYNVLIIPAPWGPWLADLLGKPGADQISKWVADGGTLICMGSAAAWAADSSSGLSSVRLKRQVLDKLDRYQKDFEKQVQAEAPKIDTMAIWHPDKVPPAEAKTAEAPAGGPAINEETDNWQRKFFPRGVLMRVDLNTESWLAFGMKPQVPATVYSDNAFMATRPVDIVGRFSADENKLRMSGLLWPEARTRWAGAAYVTQESVGKGQIILFSNDPFVRAYFWGTRQLFANAVLYGPGMGATSAEPYQK